MSGEPVLVTPGASIEQALEVIAGTGTGVAALADSSGQVSGTITDGDIRRAVLGGARLDAAAHGVAGPPVLVGPTSPDAEILALLDQHQASAAAVVDGGRLVAWRRRGDVGPAVPTVAAVVLAGGRGQRLRPLTDKVPKPLLTVGRTTILERLLEQLRDAGITEVHLAVNYKAEVFEQRLGDGATMGLDLRYLREQDALGTAGPLALLEPPPERPVLVTMADQVTSLPFERLVEFHRQQQAAVTVAAFLHRMPIPYGVLRLEGARVLGIEEKPNLERWCNAGIFVIEPEVVALVPPEQMLGMPDLVEAALAKGWPVTAFPILERWIDVGSPEALEAALMAFATGDEV
ncbi:MAG TPA: sugar phosphate nucleotidyltransferase [Acidimicrobiales bacterium]|nr:sugar phosphate nucleotidyltransferase [Acidimicrobiales bacterium]